MPPYAGVLRELLQETRNLQFLKPTAPLRKMLLLSELNRRPRASQRALAAYAGISVSVANEYLGSFLEAGLATRSSLNRRDFSYLLTQEGNAHLTEQVLRYLREVLILSNSARSEIAMYLEDLLRDKGVKRLAIYPAGEVAESILHALEDVNVEVTGIVDDDAGRHGMKVQGLDVLAPENLASLSIDGVLVATYQHRAAILARLSQIDLHGAKVVCL